MCACFHTVLHQHFKILFEATPHATKLSIQTLNSCGHVTMFRCVTVSKRIISYHRQKAVVMEVAHPAHVQSVDD